LQILLYPWGLIMRRFQCVLLAAVAVIGFASVGSAADLPVKAAPPAPPAAMAVYDWSGFYIGGDAGRQWSRIDLSETFLGVAGPLTYNPHHDSFALGAFGGVQRQFGQFVLGIEGGYMAAFNDASLGATPSLSIFFPGGTGTAQAKLKYLWSVGGRVGWAVNQWMPYLTGGYANGTFEFDGQDAVGTEQAKTSTGGGYIGGGIDWAFTKNWIIGAEFRHYGFGTKSVTAAAISSSGIVRFTETVNFAPRTETIMARVSYKFDWPR
jgi:outer membrane immunogenic protein